MATRRFLYLNCFKLQTLLFHGRLIPGHKYYQEYNQVGSFGVLCGHLKGFHMAFRLKEASLLVTELFHIKTVSGG